MYRIFKLTNFRYSLSVDKLHGTLTICFYAFMCYLLLIDCLYYDLYLFLVAIIFTYSAFYSSLKHYIYKIGQINVLIWLGTAQRYLSLQLKNNRVLATQYSSSKVAITCCALKQNPRT